MDTLLKDVIQKHSKKIPSSSQLSRLTNLARSTVSDALNRPIGKTSFAVVIRLLVASEISLTSIVPLSLNEELSPDQEERQFLNKTSLKDLKIMGVKFSSPENFWKTRDSILNSIYEGAHPTKDDVLDAYKQLEEKVPATELISDLIKHYGGK